MQTICGPMLEPEACIICHNECHGSPRLTFMGDDGRTVPVVGALHAGCASRAVRLSGAAACEALKVVSLNWKLVRLSDGRELASGTY